MKRVFGGLLFLLFFSIGSRAFADDETPGKLTFWKEYLVGSGGSVPSLWTFGSGMEYAFFRDDDNHEVSFSADLFNDRTSYTSQKLLLPILVNYRWYAGSRPALGWFVSGGLGEAIPFGLDHGSGGLAWQLGTGYIVSKKFAVEIRYLGRRRQTMSNSAGTFTTNNAFTGAMVHFIF